MSRRPQYRALAGIDRKALEAFQAGIHKRYTDEQILSVSGGYSTSDGFIGEVAVSETNFLGRGQFVRVAGQLGQRAQRRRLLVHRAVLPRLPDGGRYRPVLEVQRPDPVLPLREPDDRRSAAPRPAVHGRVHVTAALLAVPAGSHDPERRRSSRTTTARFRSRATRCSTPTARRTACSAKATAKPRWRSRSRRARRFTSLAGLTFNYNTLDSTEGPAQRLLCRGEDGLRRPRRRFALLPRDRRCPLLPRDVRGRRRYRPRPGRPHPGLRQRRRDGGSGDLRIVDQFFLGPSLVRGFATNGIGPRDISSLDTRANAIGGTTYFGGSLEVQFPIFGLPRELGLKGAVFADAGTLFGYKGPTRFDTSGNASSTASHRRAACTNSTQPQKCIAVRDSKMIRSSVGAIHPVDVAARPDPLRLRVRPDQGRRRHRAERRPGRRRPDPGLPLLGRHALLIGEGAARRRPRLFFMTEPNFFPQSQTLTLASGRGDGAMQRSPTASTGSFRLGRRSARERRAGRSRLYGQPGLWRALSRRPAPAPASSRRALPPRCRPAPSRS